MSLELISIVKHWPMKDIFLSFTLHTGESLALLGPSGCGKSSVLRIIAGLLPPDSGRVVIGGRDVTALSPGKRGVGMVFQESALFPHLSVEDNIGYGPRSAGKTNKESRQIAAFWLERFSLSGFARRNVDSLSGGERQRVSLARTLAVEPAVVLFDEALTALDQELRVRLGCELRERQRELGYTAVYVTHDREEAQRLADRVLVME